MYWFDYCEFGWGMGEGGWFDRILLDILVGSPGFGRPERIAGFRRRRKVCKVSDFGLSRDVNDGDTYLKKSKGKGNPVNRASKSGPITKWLSADRYPASIKPQHD